MAEQNERVNGEREERSDAEETLETVLADLLLLLLFELIEDVLRGERATRRAIGKVLRLIPSVTEDVIIVRLVVIVGVVIVVRLVVIVVRFAHVVVIVGIHFAHVVIATSGAADVVIVVATSGGGADVVAILVTAVATNGAVAIAIAIAITIAAVLVFQYLVHLGIASSVAPVHCLVREGIIALLFRRHALGLKHVTHQEEGAKIILNRWKTELHF